MSQPIPTKLLPAISLPTKIQQFIEINSSTKAYKQRSYSHQSLLDAYMVASFLEEANEPIPTLKRNAGLRDLAQRLLLWPGDVIMELQRDALKAIELLEVYVKGSLDAEVSFIERFEANPSKYKSSKPVLGKSSKETEDLKQLRDSICSDLASLKESLKKRILRNDEDPSIGLFDFHDLTPFIPGFTSSRNNSTSATTNPKKKPSGKLPQLFKHANSGKMNTDRTETLILVEQLHIRINETLEELKASLGSGFEMKLKENEECLSDMRQAIDSIELKLGALTRREKRVDWFA